MSSLQGGILLARRCLWRGELARYQRRALTDDVRFLSLSGLGQEVRETGAMRKAALCAYVIREDDMVSVQRCIDHKLRNVRFGPLGILARDGFRLVTAFDALHPFGLPGINVGVYRSARLVSPAQEEVVSTVVGLISDAHNRD
jgi:hypothetical protein